MRSIEKVIDNARVERGATRVEATAAITCAGQTGREYVDTATTGAVRDNCRLECGLSASAFDIESLSRTGRLVAYLFRVRVRVRFRAHTRDERRDNATRRTGETNFGAALRPIVSCINTRRSGFIVSFHSGGMALFRGTGCLVK